MLLRCPQGHVFDPNARSWYRCLDEPDQPECSFCPECGEEFGKRDRDGVVTIKPHFTEVESRQFKILVPALDTNLSNEDCTHPLKVQEGNVWQVHIAQATPSEHGVQVVSMGNGRISLWNWDNVDHKVLVTVWTECPPPPPEQEQAIASWQQESEDSLFTSRS